MHWERTGQPGLPVPCPGIALTVGPISNSPLLGSEVFSLLASVQLGSSFSMRWEGGFELGAGAVPLLPEAP